MIKAPSRHCARNQQSLVLHTEFRSRGYRLSRHRSGIRNRHIVGFGVQKTITTKALGGKASIPSTVVESSNVKMEGGRAMVEYTFGHTEVSLLLEETGDEVSGSHVVLQLFIFSLDGYVLIHEQKSRV